MAAFYSFPSIENGRYVIEKLVETFMQGDEDALEVEGITKLHGTCAAIVKHDHPDGKITFQSRSRTITPEDDNSSFATLMTTDGGMDAVRNMFSQIEAVSRMNLPIIVYGEWCGKGIQKNVAVNLMEKTFVIFKIAFGTTGGKIEWADMDKYKSVAAPPLIRNIKEIPSYSFVLRKSSLQEDLLNIDKVVQEIDGQCPFAFQIHGLSGAGEGLVLRPKQSLSSEFWWKAKGESHQRTVPKVRNDPKGPPEKETNFAFKHVTYERLASAKEAQHITPKDEKCIMKHFSALLKWTVNDIEREEGFNGLDPKQASRAIGARLKELLLADKGEN